MPDPNAALDGHSEGAPPTREVPASSLFEGMVIMADGRSIGTVDRVSEVNGRTFVELLDGGSESYLPLWKVEILDA